MDPQEAIPAHCPSCDCSAPVVPAVSIAVDDALAASRLLDVRLRGRSLWSGMWLCSLGCFALGLVAWLIAPSTGWLQAAGVFVIFGLTFALLGVWQTRDYRERMLGAEPLVLRTHARALYCRACECVYFAAGKLPEGLRAGQPLPASEYRRRLWYACGFTKPI